MRKKTKEASPSLGSKCCKDSEMIPAATDSPTPGLRIISELDALSLRKKVQRNRIRNLEEMADRLRGHLGAQEY